MKRFLACLQAVALLAAQLLVGISVELAIPKPAFAATAICGAAQGVGATFSNPNVLHFTKCATGANVGGYTVTSAQIYISGTTTGTVYGAIYTDNAGSPGNKLCSDTTGISPAANQYNTDNLSGCGTLAASTTYWVADAETSASIADFFTGCSFNVTWGVNGTPGTWPSTGAGTSTTGACYMDYIQGNPATAQSTGIGGKAGIGGKGGI